MYTFFNASLPLVSNIRCVPLTLQEFFTHLSHGKIIIYNQNLLLTLILQKTLLTLFYIGNDTTNLVPFLFDFPTLFYHYGPK